LANLFKNHTLVTINQIGSIASSNSSSGNINSIIASSHHKRIWILDSGATVHVCVSLHFFSYHTRIKPIQITLPNGETVTVEQSGTIHFSLTFYLTNVLYVPHFSFNLNSVSQLIKILNCKLIFSSLGCDIQDSQSNATIGSANHAGGLYFYKHVQTHDNNLFAFFKQL